jgi:hypothetical protein
MIDPTQPEPAVGAGLLIKHWIHNIGI